MIPFLENLKSFFESVFEKVGQPIVDAATPQPKAAAGSPKIVKALECLVADFQTNLRGYLAEAEAIGYPLVVLETCRTHERQAWIYGQGRPGYTYLGVLYGRPGNIVSHAQPGMGKHEIDEAADTWPKGLTFKDSDSDRAVEIFQGPLAPLRAKYGLKNLPQIYDYGHVERA